MKWLSFLVVVFTGIGLLFQAAAVAEAEVPVEIDSITYTKESDGQEKIQFKLNDLVVPKLFSLKGDNPRLVVDFPGAVYKGKNTIALADGELATAIRVGLHKEPSPKTRVVIDLSKQTVVKYSHEVKEQDKVMVVTLGPEGVASKPEPIPVVKKQELKPSPKKEELASVPLEEKPVPPVFSVKEMQDVPDSKAVATVGSPQLLDISFDDSSNRGEMVLFHLNDFYPPTVSAIEKDNPRVLCDFMEMSLVKGIKDNIFANGKYVERIRTAKHKNPKKVRVVLDLSPDRDYDLQQVFFKNDNLFVLIVNELSSEKVVQ